MLRQLHFETGSVGICDRHTESWIMKSEREQKTIFGAGSQETRSDAVESELVSPAGALALRVNERPSAPISGFAEWMRIRISFYLMCEQPAP
jgi:hypothetical protein